MKSTSSDTAARSPDTSEQTKQAQLAGSCNKIVQGAQATAGCCHLISEALVISRSDEQSCTAQVASALSATACTKCNCPVHKKCNQNACKHIRTLLASFEPSDYGGL
ncbi:hypothetical protein ACOSP7_020981 [Xanthoceras sorbifolium]